MLLESGAILGVSVGQTPHLRWVYLEGFIKLPSLTLDYPGLASLGNFDTLSLVRVTSRSQCPLMGCNEAQLLARWYVSRGAMIPTFAKYRTRGSQDLKFQVKV